jgi:polyhydroxybutyrate depolymerase
MFKKFCIGSLLVALSACSSDTTEPSGTADGGTSGGGSGGSGGTTGGAPAGGTANNPSGGAGTGGTGQAGGSTGGTAGTTTTTGGSGGDSAGGTAGSGGMSGGEGGMAGGMGGTGGSDGKPAPKPSAGCGKQNPTTGSGNQPLTVSGHNYYVKLPGNYDANKPYPVMIMFNPTGNPITWAEQNAGFEGQGPREAWIRVYPHMGNQQNGWNGSDVPFFEPFYDKIVSDYCIDQARVFVAGESSGGDFVSILGCEYGDKIAATAPCATKPVNGYSLNLPTTRQCKGDPIAVVIHGKNDNVVGTENGPKTRDFYASINNCSNETEPVQGYTDTLSNCVMYKGCDAPVYWCQHTDPNYSNTNHGWPGFAPKFLWEKLSQY